MSVLRINHNPIAINANRNLKLTGRNIATTIERLSSGLRINRAADDAAGLSISEKLRAQVRGLNRASANALDGISLIQTAEGALNEIHSVLQRMRELAVQSSNGVYTASDRRALQLEVNQLIDEIDRIATTTEFNTKRLLDGTMGALISSDDMTRFQAAVTGFVGNGGNFVINSAVLSEGQMQVQKSDVFTTEGDIDTRRTLNYLHTVRAGATVTTAGPDGIGNTGIDKVEIPVSFGTSLPAGLVAVNSSTPGQLTIMSASGSAGTDTIGMNLQAQEITNGDKLMFTVNTGSNVSTVSVALDTTMTNQTLANAISAALGGLHQPVSLAYDAANSRFSFNLVAGYELLNTQFVDSDESGSNFHFTVNSLGLSNRFFSSFFYSFENNGNVFVNSASRAMNDTGQYFSIGSSLTTGVININFETKFDWSQVSVGFSSRTDELAWTTSLGGNSLQESGTIWQTGAVPQNSTFLVSAIDQRSYKIFEFDNAAYTSLVNQGWDQSDALTSARGAVMINEFGNSIASISQTFAGQAGSYLENVRLGFDGIFQAGETATFNLTANSVLTADQMTTLASLNRFEEFGVFRGKKHDELEVLLRGTKQSVDIAVSANDTLEDLAGKLSLAIWNPDGSGVLGSDMINPALPPDLVHVNTLGIAKGTFSITTPVPGAEIVLAGDETLMKALSLVEVLEAKAPIHSISAYDMDTAQSIGRLVTDTDEIVGLIPGVKIFFDNTAGMMLDPQPPTDINGGPNSMGSFPFMQALERPRVSLSARLESFFMHVAAREFSLQIGANKNQTLSNYIGDQSAKALGIEGLLIADAGLSQDAISIIDTAIQRVSTQRGRLGAMQNRLESTVRNIDIAAENLTNAESRIRDADIARETMIATRNEILLQAGVAALAQANQLPQAVLQLLR